MKKLQPERWRSVAFFGDSIVEGVTSDYRRTKDTWCKIVADEYGFRHQNFGRGGSCFTPGCNGKVPSISETIKEADITGYDAIFIGGGINDWMFDAPLGEFKRSLDETLHLIKSRFDGDIIFITPIYPSIIKRIKKSGFVKYEGIVARRAYDARISVIRGIYFKWDTILNTSSKKILWDGIHPTELGYRIYAENVEKQIDAI